MKSSAKKVELASVDDLFSTEESRADAGREKVVEIPLSELHSFKGHPFKVKDDDAMPEETENSIHANDKAVVQPEKKIPFPVNPKRKMNMQNRAELPQQKITVTVKESIIEQIKAEQNLFLWKQNSRKRKDRRSQSLPCLRVNIPA